MGVRSTAAFSHLAGQSIPGSLSRAHIPSTHPWRTEVLGEAPGVSQLPNVRLLLASQPFCCIYGRVCEDNVCSSAAEAHERFQCSVLLVKPPSLCCSLEHGVLARHVVCGDGQRRVIPLQDTNKSWITHAEMHIRQVKWVPACRHNHADVTQTIHLSSCYCRPI